MTTRAAPSAIKVVLPVVAIALVTLGGGVALKYWEKYAGQSGNHVEVKVGDTVPDFTAAKFGGGSLKFSEMKSKVTMVNFWATWCEACIIEMPSIVKLRESYKDQGFEVVGVSLDENQSLVGPALKKFGMAFPIVTDDEGKLGELFEVHAIPVTFILDRSGKVLFIHRGELDWNSTKFRERLGDWLKG